jgi:hypothetical protein
MTSGKRVGGFPARGGNCRTLPVASGTWGETLNYPVG